MGFMFFIQKSRLYWFIKLFVICLRIVEHYHNVSKDIRFIVEKFILKSPIYFLERLFVVFLNKLI